MAESVQLTVSAVSYKANCSRQERDLVQSDVSLQSQAQRATITPSRFQRSRQKRSQQWS